MKREIIFTLCCASLMLVTPFTTVAQDNTVSNNLSGQPDDVEGLVAQIRVVIDEILEKYGHNKIVRDVYYEIRNIIGLNDRYPIVFCTLFLIAISPFFIFIWKMWEIFSFNIFLDLAKIIILPWGLLCYYPWINTINLPLKTLNSLSEIKDITLSFDSCPCLQE